MADAAPRSHVIADRYLTSPAALASHPFGPVDALDTHSGRGAQVRIVFVDGGWDEAGLADAVARWCGIGCSEVCGVLDFGRHADRWFLVLPPTLGLPVERWRTLRRPTAADAARLALAFGRLAERVAAAGFSPDAASLSDVAVGPGPTPFLERPLLCPANAPRTAGGDGQRVLAAVCDAALGSLGPPAALREWAEHARTGEYADLTECLNELERCGDPGHDGDADASDLPPGLEHLFDEEFDLDGPALTSPPRRRGLRLAGVPVVTIALLGIWMFVGHGVRESPASTTPDPGAAPRTTAVVSAPATHAGRTPPTGAHVKAPNHTHPGAHRHPRRHRSAQTATPTTPSQATSTATTPPAAPPAATTAGGGSSSGAVTLPAPGGTTLPAP